MFAYSLLFLGFAHLLEIVVMMRILTRPYREPSSRLAWMFVIFFIPALGVILYAMLWETNIGRKHELRSKYIRKKLHHISFPHKGSHPVIPEKYARIFSLLSKINDFPITGGNRAHLTKDDEDALNTIIADIDSAQESVHLCFYIWLDDTGGMRVLDAVERAYKRGVICRVLVDAVGSKKLLTNKRWYEMRKLGVEAHVIFWVKRNIFAFIPGRIDIRNHRKIAVIDNTISYVGSQNCCDPSFYVKKKYAPWVDIWLRIEWDAVRENQKLFISDWYITTGEDITEVLHAEKVKEQREGFPAGMVWLGPTELSGASNYIFQRLLLQAEKKLMITTPYFVPTDPLISSLCSIALTGVKVVMMFPEKNDSFIVAAASRSYYKQLLQSGVQIFHYKKWILHAKIVTLDGEACFLGSSNLDRRSFELNFENNMFFVDENLTQKIIERQKKYLEDCREVTLQEVESWSFGKKLYYNTVATMWPVL